MTIKLIYEDERERFEALSDYEDREILRQAGFRWDPDRRVWHTCDAARAATLRDKATPECLARLAAVEPISLTPRLRFSQGEYIFESPSAAWKDAPKDAGFQWDKTRFCWVTHDPDKAAAIAQYADDGCRQALKEAKQLRAAAREASRAVDAGIEIPVPNGLEYMGFQRAGIAFALQQTAALKGGASPSLSNEPQRGVLIADEMG
jgi:hypothetical protein